MLIKTFHSQGSDNSVEVGVERISELKDGKSAVTSAFGIWHGCSHELTIGVNNCSRISRHQASQNTNTDWREIHKVSSLAEKLLAVDHYKRREPFFFVCMATGRHALLNGLISMCMLAKLIGLSEVFKRTRRMQSLKGNIFQGTV